MSKPAGAEVEYYAYVQETDIEWLWYPFIPYGKITLLQGDPGDGKSTFMLHIAATLSVGGTLPDGTEVKEKHSVIYQCSEDSNTDTIKPRLMRAGADCDRVAYINEENYPLTIDDPRIEEAILKTGARLLIIDPIQAYIPSDCDMTNASSMRGIMKKLAEVAARQRCAIVLIGHMTKSGGNKNLYRSFGSIDIAAIVRSVLMIKRDEENPSIRYMFPVKSSLAYEGSAVRFMFTRESGLQMLGTCEIDSMEATDADPADEKGKMIRTERMLRELLGSGDVPSKSVLDIVRDKGISERTARSAAKNIGVRSIRKGNAWYWSIMS